MGFGCNRRERDERDEVNERDEGHEVDVEGDVEVDVEEGEQAYACDQGHVSSEVDIEEGEQSNACGQGHFSRKAVEYEFRGLQQDGLPRPEEQYQFDQE